MGAIKYVGFAAHSEDVSSELAAKATRIIEGLSECYNADSLAIVVGGYWGLMRKVVDAALELGLRVIIMPPLEREDVEFPERAIVIRTGASYRLRSIFLVRTSDALVVLGGGAGCLQELVTAYTEGRPSFVLVGTGLPTDIVAGLPEYLDHRRLAPIKRYSDELSLLEDLCKYLRGEPVEGAERAAGIG